MADNPFFTAIQAHCLSKPDAVEDYPWGDVVWKVRGKMFAAAGRESANVTVKSSLEKQSVLILDPAITVAAYVGRFGWVSVAVSEDNLNFALDLIDESYEMVTSKKRQSKSQL